MAPLVASRDRRRRWRFTGAAALWSLGAGYVIGYFGLAELTTFAPRADSVLIVRPAVALALALLLAGGNRWIPLVLLTAFVAHLVAPASTGFAGQVAIAPLGRALAADAVDTIVTTACYAVAASLLRRVAVLVLRLRAVLSFLLLGCVAAPASAALLTTGAARLLSIPTVHGGWTATAALAASEALPILIVVPLLLLGLAQVPPAARTAFRLGNLRLPAPTLGGERRAGLAARQRPVVRTRYGDPAAAGDSERVAGAPAWLRLPPSRPRLLLPVLEGSLQAVALAVTAIIALAARRVFGHEPLFLVFVPAIWVALRWGVVGALVAAPPVDTLLLLGSRPAFTGGHARLAYLDLVGFLFVQNAATLCLAAVTTERLAAAALLHRRAVQHEGAAWLGRLALTGAPYAALCEEACRVVAETLGVEQAAVLERGDDGQFVLAFSVGWPPNLLGTPVGGVGENAVPGFPPPGRPLILSAEHVPRTPGALVLPAGPASAVLARVEGRERVRAVLLAGSPQPRDFSVEDADFLQSVANVLAVALEERAAQGELEHVALYDNLTGLPNRAQLFDRLRAALATPHAAVAVLLLDLDRFQLVNDSLGHAAGDTLLRDVALRLRAALVPHEFFARIGGDEFVVLCADLAPATIEADVQDVARRLGEALAAPFEVAGTEVVVTASIGIAVRGSGGRHSRADAVTLMRDADAAVNQAKERGGSRSDVFEAGLHERARIRLETASALRRGIAANELRLDFQPIVALDRAEIVAVEALVRWRHPERGELVPSQFLPVAEESAPLAADLARWVLDSACRVVAGWNRRASLPVTLAVNIGPRVWRDGMVADLVARALRDSGLPAPQLCLELARPRAAPESLARAVREVRELGVHVALDHFGSTGVSFAELRRLPVDVLKIDPELVAELARHPQADAVVASVLGLAAELRLRVIAEGVERAEQADVLRRHGCELAQGFYFAVPASAAEVAAQLGLARSAE